MPNFSSSKTIKNIFFFLPFFYPSSLPARHFTPFVARLAVFQKSPSEVVGLRTSRKEENRKRGETRRDKRRRNSYGKSVWEFHRDWAISYYPHPDLFSLPPSANKKETPFISRKECSVMQRRSRDFRISRTHACSRLSSRGPSILCGEFELISHGKSCKSRRTVPSCCFYVCCYAFPAGNYVLLERPR